MTTEQQDQMYDGLLSWLRTNHDQVVDEGAAAIHSVDQALAAHRDRMAEFGVDLTDPVQRRAYVAALGHGVGVVLAVAMEGRIAVSVMPELVHRIGFGVHFEDYREASR